jgi:hypothetical protein
VQRIDEKDFVLSHTFFVLRNAIPQAGVMFPGGRRDANDAAPSVREIVLLDWPIRRRARRICARFSIAS